MLEFEQSPKAHTMRIKRRVLALALLVVLDAYGMLAASHQDLKPVQASNRSAAIHFGSAMAASAATEPREAWITAGTFSFQPKPDHPEKGADANHVADGQN
jgi:hypothetical protein